MSYSTLSMVVIAASLFVCDASADDTHSAPPPATEGGHPMALHGMFTREERMMLFADFFKATSEMNDDQRRAYRSQERSRIMAMSDADRANFKTDLDSRWSALSADQKAAMAVKMQAFMATRHPGEHAE
jgi:hypothetical protein